LPSGRFAIVIFKPVTEVRFFQQALRMKVSFERIPMSQTVVTDTTPRPVQRLAVFLEQMYEPDNLTIETSSEYVKIRWCDRLLMTFYVVETGIGYSLHRRNKAYSSENRVAIKNEINQTLAQARLERLRLLEIP